MANANVMCGYIICYSKSLPRSLSYQGEFSLGFQNENDKLTPGNSVSFIINIFLEGSQINGKAVLSLSLIFSFKTQQLL